MSIRLLPLTLLATTLNGQIPDISGVWRASIGKSTITGTPPADYLVVIAKQGPRYTIKTLIVRTPANTKSVAEYDASVDQTSNWIRGNPTKSHSAWDGSTLRISSSFMFDRAEQTYSEEWSLNSDGMLTYIRVQPPAPVTKVIFEKQPDSQATSFDQPEKTAKEAYGNVTALNVPASSLLGIMNTYCLSLGVACNHCHVNGQWAKDDVPAKDNARKMILMTRTLNQGNFSPRVGVSCYTCHRGNAKPALVPPE